MDCYRKIQLKNGAVVPCGKCPACKANERQEWIFRLKQEYLESEFALFVTLTYDEEHVPLDMSVHKEDVQKFHKRLRKHLPAGDLRFYVVSEYGDRTHRPHYHGLYFFKTKYDLNFIYDIFEKAWQQGFLKFGNVEEGSIVYCTKYCMKGSEVPEGCAKTFRLVSKMNGGLGINYLKNMNDYHADSLNLSFVYCDGKRSRMPRYYKTKIQFASNYDKSIIEARNEEIIATTYQNNVARFKEFLKTHKGLSYEDAIKQFNEQRQKGFVERDKLLIKHVKKQKL